MILNIDGQDCQVSPLKNNKYNNMSVMKVIKPNGNICTHVRGINDPVWYYDDETDNIELNDPSQMAVNWESPSVGNIRLKKGNMFVGYRLNPVKTFGIRPSWSQKANNISLEFSIKEYYLDGQKIEIDYNDVEVLNNTSIRVGNMLATTNQVYGKTAFKCYNTVTDFSIPITIYLKGLTVSEENGDFVFKTNNGKFFCKFTKPTIVDESFSIIQNTENFINHSLVENNNGTYTYTKYSTSTFSENSYKLSPIFYVDVYTIYSSVEDGSLQGPNRTASSAYSYIYNGNYEQIWATSTVVRGFLPFDLSTITDPCTARLSLYFRQTVTLNNLSVCESTKSDSTLAITDFNYLNMTNELGYSYLNGVSSSRRYIDIEDRLNHRMGDASIVWLVTRDRNDVINSMPSSGFADYWSTNYSVSTVKPYLELTPPKKTIYIREVGANLDDYEEKTVINNLQTVYRIDSSGDIETGNVSLENISFLTNTINNSDVEVPTCSEILKELQDTIECYILDINEEVQVKNGIMYVVIPENLNGYKINSVFAKVSIAGTDTGNTTIQIYNTTQSLNMLSTVASIEPNETTTTTATTQPVPISTTLIDGDVLRIDITNVTTSTPPLGLFLSIRLEL
jgi:hypothetical protein